ncbi:MAG TPA: MFS transporter [Acetobacteraceae bacterium]|nr:MFS transporter [Acetobacteraceae bacterium]
MAEHSRHRERAGPVAVGAWVLYDWAYGAFNTVVTTFVFATYFTQAVAPDPARGAALWAWMQAAAGLAIALLSVPLGAVADRGGRRRPFLAVATSVMAACTLLLWTVHPRAGDMPRALLLVGIGTVAFEVATVFYNAMLPDLVSPRHLGRLSMLGWGAGYAGGLVCLGLCLGLLLFPKPPLFGLDAAQAEPVRATALLAGAWLVAFSWPAAVFVPERGGRMPWRAALRDGAVEMRAVLRAAWAQKPLRRFLLARLLFMDGLTTLFAFGGIYAAGQFGLTPTEVLVFGIGLNVAAGLGALGFAPIEDRIGAKAAVMVSLICLAGLSTALLLIHARPAFWVLGHALGLFVGPAQAASRSLLARMAPADARAAFFGLFALSGRVTGFVGPAALGLATAAFASQRAGMAVIVVLLAAGALALAGVPSPPLDAGAPGADDDIGEPDALREQQQQRQLRLQA